MPVRVLPKGRRTQPLPAPPEAQPVPHHDSADLRDRLDAAWPGRIIGGNLGKPVEDGLHWTVERIRDQLERAGAYPVTASVLVLTPMRAEFRLHEDWPATTRGNGDGSARGDDSDYSILAVHRLELHGCALQPEHVAETWTALLPLQQVFTAERAAYINLANGLVPPELASHGNPCREWIGAQIRGDVFGEVFPGDPGAAAELAYQDASRSHVSNGIYGEMWAAALVSAAFTARTAHEAVSTSLRVVPWRSRLAAITHVLRLHVNELSPEDALARIREEYGHYAWVHTVNNAAVVAAGPALG